MSAGTPPVAFALDQTERAGRKLSQLAHLGVSELRKVGPRKTAALAEMGISSVLDLLTHYPRRYADRTNAVSIADSVLGEEAVISARITKVNTRRIRGRRPLVEVGVADGSGRLTVTFFNQPWRARQLEEGANVVVFGKIEEFRGTRRMTNPIVDLVGDQTGRIVPIYPQSGKAGIGSNELGNYVEEALDRAGKFAEPLSAEIRRRLGLATRTEAFRSIHRPETLDARNAARRRLAFDELWRLQVALVMRKRAAMAEARGVAHRVTPGLGVPDLVGAFLAALPFELTGAQRRVIEEIAADLAAPDPMHRLLQGDVGSGKTVVALAALLYGVQGGHQGALMVPTEVLAEQHFLAAQSLLAGLVVPAADRLTGDRPIGLELLTSRTPASERQRLLAGLAAGEVDLLVGTHALITEDVAFSSLGVVVIDEQHRFGVDQRAALREKGERGSGNLGEGHDPDLLVMTATPIPRTAAMTVYGDLDYSVLDELPVGRAPIRTSWVEEPAGEDEVWAMVRTEVDKGHQAYVVCPLVRPGFLEETEEPEPTADGGDDDTPRFVFDELEERPKRPARSAVEEYERLSEGSLSGCRVGLLHGQLAAKEKETVMAAFREGRLDVLVATTVIEVGVDIANATVMVIEDADRFGIAQLHQLRGRVGRGRDRSWCFLLAEQVTESAAKRLGALEGSTDGFELAEVDLDLRGEGTVLGARQKGRNDLKLASLRRDRDLVDRAREPAIAVVSQDPTLVHAPVLADELRLFIGEEEAGYLFRS